jgi:hypothetical protein
MAALILWSASTSTMDRTAVASIDGMTADFYSFDMKFLGETATHTT